MFFTKLLSLIAFSAVFLQIQCQDEGDVEDSYYPGTSSPDYYDDATRAPVPIEIFPDLSCHPGFDKDTFENWYRECTESGSPGPNIPFIDPEYEWGACPKFCMMWEKIDLLEQDYDNPNYLDRYTRIFKFSKNPSWVINQMMGEDLGAKLMAKIETECQETLNRVFYEEKHRCSTLEAQQVYECVNNAAKCDS